MIRNVLTTWSSLGGSSVVWVTLTVLAYQAARTIHRWSGLSPFANPVLIGVTLVITVLHITTTPYETYFAGAQLLHFMLGPAVVALAVPLAAQVMRLKTMLASLLLTLTIGSVTAIGSAVGIAWLLGASAETLLSVAPKSATMPIAIAVSEKIGGVASLTALMVTLTGASGAIMARGLLNALRIDSMAVRGFAIGITAHAIGTAYALQFGEVAVAFSALGMSLNGVATTVLVPLMVQIAASW